jgi:hypothetical protein
MVSRLAPLLESAVVTTRRSCEGSLWCLRWRKLIIVL